MSPRNPNKHKKETGSNETQTTATTRETHAESTQENTHNTKETTPVHNKTHQNTSSTTPTKPPNKPIDDKPKDQEKGERKTRRRGNSNMKDRQETQEKKDENQERKTETLSEKGKKHIKRKREENTEEIVLLSVRTHHEVVKDITPHTTVIKSGFGLKQSKLTQKPIFKSKRKANPRLSQLNKINNYFPSVGTIQRGKGGGESVSFDDFNQGVLNQLRQENQPRPKTYIDNGPGNCL